jgi:uncharacterized membrane protein (DUF4010 family)
VFTLITQYTIQEFGTQGLKVLALMVGVTDITPFVISLFQGNYQVVADAVISAAFLALLSNNIVKLGYSLVLGSKLNRNLLIACFAIICAATFIVLLIV